MREKIGTVENQDRGKCSNVDQIQMDKEKREMMRKYKVKRKKVKRNRKVILT